MSKKKHEIPVVIFGDHISAFGVIKSLSIHRIPIFLVSKHGNGLATKSRWVKDVFVLDPKDKEFAIKLDAWLVKNEFDHVVLIVAGDDDYLDVLSKEYKKLSVKVSVTFPDWTKVKLVREKRYTYEIAEKIGVPVPVTLKIDKSKDFHAFIDENIAKVKFPVLLKPEDSRPFLRKYGVKGILCNDREELLSEYGRCIEYSGDLLIQEFIPGVESNLFSAIIVQNRNSNPIGFAVNKKIRSSGQYLGCTVVSSTWSKEVLQYSLKLVKEIGYIGYTGTQFKLDPRDGIFKLMEINGRVTMSNSLSTKCGVNTAYLMYQEAIGENNTELNDFKQTYKNNILWWYPAGDLGHIIRLKAYLNPLKYFRELFGGRGYVIEPFSWRDPLPGIISLTTNIPRRVLRRF